MSIRKGTTVIAGGGAGLPDQTGKSGKYLTTDGTNPSWGDVSSMPETDNTTINVSSATKLQAIGTIEKNTSTAKYDWIGTLEQYTALSTYNENWLYYITDDYQSSIATDNKSINQNSSGALQTIGVIDQNNTSNALKLWKGTQSQFDALTTKDSNTIYNVTDNSNNLQTLLETIWPVGSIYIGVMSTCPLAALFGVWQLVATDKVLQGAGSRGTVDTTIEESLPNIKGTYTQPNTAAGGFANVTYGEGATGAFYASEGSGKYSTASGTTAYGLGFDASKYSSTYQDDAPVQQDAYLVNIWKRIS